MDDERGRGVGPWILAAVVGTLLGALPLLSYRFGTHAKT